MFTVRALLSLVVMMGSFAADRAVANVRALPGDFNGNGVLECGDLELMRQMAVRLIEPTKLSDLNGNGILADAGDVTLLRSWLAQQGSDCSAQAFSVQGRVFTTGGQALRNARVRMIDLDNGSIRDVTTSSFGVFTFEGVRAGSYVSITVIPSSKRVRYNSIVTSVTQNLSGLEIHAQE